MTLNNFVIFGKTVEGNKEPVKSLEIEEKQPKDILDMEVSKRETSWNISIILIAYLGMGTFLLFKLIENIG